MEDCSSHVSSSFFPSKMPQFGVDNQTDEISSFGTKGEPLETLNDVQIAGADSNTEVRGCKSEPSPAERQRKRKRYERSKGYMEKIKKTCEKIADIEGAVLEERDGTLDIIENIEVELQKQRDETFAMIKRLKEAQQKRDEMIAFKLYHLKEARKKRDGMIAFKLKCLKKELKRLRAGTRRSEEERGLMLSVQRQQLKPQSFTLQMATGPHILGTNSESVDKVVEPIPVGRYNFPPLLHQTVMKIIEVYRDVAATPLVSYSLAEGIYIMFCASIREISELRLEQVTENLIFRWRDAIKDALRIHLTVDFAMEHLKKVARAYIGLMVRRKLDDMAFGIPSLEGQFSAGKAEHCKISEMWVCFESLLTRGFAYARNRSPLISFFWIGTIYLIRVK